jgi:hypothetical protein
VLALLLGQVVWRLVLQVVLVLANVLMLAKVVLEVVLLLLIVLLQLLQSLPLLLVCFAVYVAVVGAVPSRQATGTLDDGSSEGTWLGGCEGNLEGDWLDF